MLKKGQPSEASPRKRVRRDKRQLLNRVQLAEKPVRLAVDAGGEEERVRWTGGHAIAEGNRPESVDCQYLSILILQLRNAPLFGS